MTGYPPALLVHIAASALSGQHRSLLADLTQLANTLDPPLQVTKPEGFDPPYGSVLVAFNHYSRPDVPAWQTVIALGGALDHIGLAQPEPRWVMTAAWRHWGLLTPLSRWMLRRLAAMYTAFLMPPMPPAPQDAATSAATVRAVIHFARAHRDARVCFAPEGHDSGDGHLIMPPGGVGRFMLHLCRAGMNLLPAGVWDEDGAWHVHFGSTFALNAPDDLTPDARDEWISRRVMQAIAALMPARLRGEWAESQSLDSFHDTIEPS